MKPKTTAELAATLRTQVEADAAERLRAELDVDCTRCYDRGVIHFTDLAPSKNHTPTPGRRPDKEH
jgi:hypothetical protein